MQVSIPQLGTNERPISRTAASSIGILFLILTVIAIRYGGTQLIVLRAFLPICATLWATAELLTAFLLLSQFAVAGKLGYALLAATYAFTGLLTIPYLLQFPGLFPIPTSPSSAQISIWLWAIWHCAFPVAVTMIFLMDPTLETYSVPREVRKRVLWGSCIGALAAAALLTTALNLASSHLPILIDPHGHFAAGYSFGVAPIVVLTNAIACGLLFVRLVNPSPLQIWTGVALLASTFDGLLNALTTGRYSLGWYVGKVEAIVAASAVLVMLLYQISNLYGRLFDIASIDSLTGLNNRRALDIALSGMVGERREKKLGAALLLLDLDNFKRYNDEYGHVAGDDALRVVAGVLRSSVYRPGDKVARYGGEEFAVVLTDTDLEGARAVAERIRSNVEKTVVRIGAKRNHITASIGVAHLSNKSTVSVVNLLKAADTALYAAKRNGRNCIFVDEIAPAPLREYAGGSVSLQAKP